MINLGLPKCLPKLGLLRPGVVGFLLLASTGSCGAENSSDYWDIPGCPVVETGVYRVSILFVSNKCVDAGTVWSESVFLDSSGLLETTPGCSFTREKKAPATCSAAVEMTCPIRQYIGNVKIEGAGVLTFDGTMTIGSGCIADVIITFSA